MFDKKKFAQILKNISETYNNQRDFSKKSEINRTYLSQYMNMKLNKPPKPEILEKLANSSHGIVTYESLMVICGYTEFGNLTSKTNEIIAYISEENYNGLKNTFDSLLLMDFSNEELKSIVNAFASCCQYIIDNYNNENSIKNISDFTFNLSDKEKKGFNLLYIYLLKRLHSYANVPRKKDELFSFKKHLILKDDLNDIKLCINIIEGIKEYFYNSVMRIILNNHLFNIPILGKIAAGQPILAEEYLEGYLPMDPNIYGMKTPDDYFYLRVAGESMNLKIHNGDYALIHKQDYAEDGDIVVAIVNGDDEATLKRYKRISDNTIALEPMSTLPMEPIYINLKETNFKIIGKAIGQFGKF